MLLEIVTCYLLSLILISFSSRQHFNRGSNMQMRSYAPTRESLRRNEVAKSVLESLQEASRKRIYSQCQEVLVCSCFFFFY